MKKWNEKYFKIKYYIIIINNNYKFKLKTLILAIK